MLKPSSQRLAILTVSVVLFAHAVEPPQPPPPPTKYIPTDNNFSQDYDLVTPGSTLQLNVLAAFGYVLLSAEVEQASPLGWQGGPQFTANVSQAPEYGLHIGKFKGKYVPIGTGDQPSEPLDWRGEAKALVMSADVREVTWAGTGFFAVKRDDTAADFPAPQWQDAAALPDRSADQANDKRYPVGYKRGSTPTLAAKFLAKANIPTGMVVKAKATGPDGMTIPETVCTVAGADVTLPATAMGATLPDKIKYYDFYELQWELKFWSADWLGVGTSKNRVFCTLDTPARSPGSFLYTTLFHACAPCDGMSDMALIFPAILARFSSGVAPANTRRVVDDHPDLTSVENGIGLHYYRGWRTRVTREKDLIASGNGQCGSWATFLLSALRVHGALLPINYITISCPNDRGMLIRNYDFVGPGVSVPLAPVDFLWRNLQVSPGGLVSDDGFNWIELTLRDLDGAAGQNSIDPLSYFGNHQFLEINGNWWDPSYGVRYPGPTAAAFSTQAISGYTRPRRVPGTTFIWWDARKLASTEPPVALQVTRQVR